MMENQVTTMTIKTAMIIFSNLCGSLDIGAVNPIVAAREKRTNFVLPAVIQGKGCRKVSEWAYLVIASIAISAMENKYAIIQYGFGEREHNLAVKIPRQAINMTQIVSSQGFTGYLLK
jgi:hypothetical protein